jgi:hypothetical protein
MVKCELDDDEKENGFPMNPKPTGRAAARKKENKAHKKAAHHDGKGSSDEDSDGELRILSDLRLSLCEFVEHRTRRDRLKAAKELFEVEPTDVNKQITFRLFVNWHPHLLWPKRLHNFTTPNEPPATFTKNHLLTSILRMTQMKPRIAPPLHLHSRRSPSSSRTQ